MAQTLFTDLVTLIQSSWLNDVDANTYNTLSAVSGTNTITATGPTTVTVYAANQRFFFMPANTNTGATTLNISSIGAKNVFRNGIACVGGELRAGSPVLVIYDGTQFHVIASGSNFPLPSLTNSLSGNVALNNTANYFDGPSVAQGTAGTWFASGTVTMSDPTGANFSAKLWDGTTVIASARSTAAGTALLSISLSGFLAAPAGNLRISVRDESTTGGNILFNSSGNSKDSTITAMRIV